MSLIASAEIIVNTYTNNAQTSPSITCLANNGGWVVTWTSEGQDGSYYGVYQQRFAADGTPAGAEMQVNTETADSQSDPSVAALADGGWVVTWQSMNQDGSDYGVYRQRYDAFGNAVGMEFKANTETNSFQYKPSITALIDGGWLVAWASNLQDGSSFGIYQQRYDANGQAVDSETLVNTTTDSLQIGPCTTSLSDGGWVVAWTSDAQDGDATGAYFQRFNADGTIAGGETRINTVTAGSQANPSIAGLADGGFVATWISYGQNAFDGGWDIFQKRYAADGTEVGGEQPVNSETINTQANPVVTGLTNGGWVVSWVSAGQDGSSDGIYLQYYNADGSLNGGERLVNTTTAGAQESPTITALSNGGFVVAWHGETSNGDQDIYQKVFHPVTNTAPAGTSTTITINEDFRHDFSAADFGFSDAENDVFHAVVISNITGFGLLTLDGAIVHANDQIDAKDLGKLAWTPGANIAGAGIGSISFSVIDDGGTIGGGVDTDPTANTLVFDVAANNDAPSGTSAKISVPSGNPYGFTAADFGFHDEIDGDHLMSVILTTLPADGALTLAGVAVQGYQEIPVSQIGDLVWTPPAGTGKTTFYFQVRDDGGIANDGVDTDQAPETLTISYGQHLAPEGENIALQSHWGTPVNFAASQFQLTDPDGDQLLSIVVTSLPTAGTLTLAGVAVAAGQEIAATDIGNLLWTPPANGAGTAMFSFQIRDNGGVAGGGADLDPTPNNVTIAYGPHQAPQGADVALYVLEDAPISFSANQFLFADADGDHMTGIIVSSLPAAGNLTLHGQAVAAGTFIAEADISWLAWTPVKNAFGNDLGTFTFQVVDDGSLANGGENTDQTASLVAIHVSDVLDRFIGTSGKNHLTGTAGNDLLDGRAGIDKLTGGAGGDLFVFRARDGRDVVTDFDAGPTGTDIIDIRKIAAITDFADLTDHHMHEAKGNVIIDGYGTSRITLKGVAMADLTADDFIF